MRLVIAKAKVHGHLPMRAEAGIERSIAKIASERKILKPAESRPKIRPTCRDDSSITLQHQTGGSICGSRCAAEVGYHDAASATEAAIKRAICIVTQRDKMSARGKRSQERPCHYDLAVVLNG